MRYECIFDYVAIATNAFLASALADVRAPRLRSRGTALHAQALPPACAMPSQHDFLPDSEREVVDFGKINIYYCWIRALCIPPGLSIADLSAWSWSVGRVAWWACSRGSTRFPVEKVSRKVRFVVEPAISKFFKTKLYQKGAPIVYYRDDPPCAL